MQVLFSLRNPFNKIIIIFFITLSTSNCCVKDLLKQHKNKTTVVKSFQQLSKKAQETQDEPCLQKKNEKRSRSGFSDGELLKEEECNGTEA